MLSRAAACVIVVATAWTGAGAAAPVAAQEPAPARDTKPESPFLASLEQGFARATAERKLLFVDLHHPL